MPAVCWHIELGIEMGLDLASKWRTDRESSLPENSRERGGFIRRSVHSETFPLSHRAALKYICNAEEVTYSRPQIIINVHSLPESLLSGYCAHPARSSCADDERPQGILEVLTKHFESYGVLNSVGCLMEQGSEKIILRVLFHCC